ncbi:DUF294 nucleotidyltransferase-like domain-containing protein [Paenibacillus terrigena]|uniref:DUF294 nucleotidyltransferase-like domain-containing protein n=1 Tax=Paenibacillus terrigena TaxID=369333 RepID=UPI00036B6BD6|nr:DUF294 nucleotidyltransferase-like domain-containing protein [Paenibacillus terrigena]
MEQMGVAMEALGAATSVHALRLLRDQYQTLWSQAVDSTQVLEWNVQLNRWHDALIAATIRLCEQMLVREGWGHPPVRYAFVLFGSGGRSEQAQWSDQDHGLIMEDTTDSSVLEYFEHFSKVIVEQLMVLGFPRCKGQVLVSNSVWRKSMKQWEEQLRLWLEDLSWEHVRYLLIASDMRPVFGDEDLAAEWRALYTNLLKRTPGIAEAMLRNTLYYKASINSFGQIIRERFGEFAGGVNLKYGAYIPLVNGIRYLAITTGLRVDQDAFYALQQPSTWERFMYLKQNGSQDTELLSSCEIAFRSVLARRATIPFVIEEGEYVSHGYVTESDLTRDVVRALKKELQAVHGLQRYLNRQIRVQMRNER